MGRRLSGIIIMLRDKTKNIDYFDRFIQLKKQEYSEYSRKNKQVSEYSKASILSDTCYELFSASYSRGDQLSKVKKWFISYVKYEVEMHRCTLETDVKPWQTYSKNFLERATDLGLCILIDLPDELEARFVKQIDALEGDDPIWNKMVEYIGYAPAAEAEELVLQNLYVDLWACFTEDTDKRAENLESFVKKWYRQCARHQDARTGLHNIKEADYYHGYWCFEAAAVAKMLDIDDSALKDHPHYPYDMRHGQ